MRKIVFAALILKTSSDCDRYFTFRRHSLFHKTEAPFLCIEPWENLPSKEGEIEDLTQKENIGFVKEGMSSECEITVTIG